MNSAYAYLAILDPPAGLQAVTDRIGITPTKIKVKGDRKHGTMVEKHDSWILESPIDRSDCDLTRHVRELLTVLEPKKSEIRQVVAESSGRLTMVDYHEHPNREFFLGAQQLALVAEMGLDIWYDSYLSAT